jgi:hypothetical protein
VAFGGVPSLLVGGWFGATALRASVTNVIAAPFPVFWNAGRA